MFKSKENKLDKLEKESKIIEEVLSEVIKGLELINNHGLVIGTNYLNGFRYIKGI